MSSTTGASRPVPAGVPAAVADQASDDKLLSLFADGATIVLQGVHRTWDPVLRFSQDLSAGLAQEAYDDLVPRLAEVAARMPSVRSWVRLGKGETPGIAGILDGEALIEAAVSRRRRPS